MGANSFGAAPSGAGWRVSNHQTIPPATTMTIEMIATAVLNGISHFIYEARWSGTKKSPGKQGSAPTDPSRKEGFARCNLGCIELHPARFAGNC